MMRRGFLTVFLSVLGALSTVRGAFEERPAGARSAGLAGALPPGGDLWGGVSFPGSLHSLKGMTFGASLSPAPFGLNELTRSACAVALPGVLDGAVIYVSRLGFGAYTEHEIGIGFCKAIGPKFRAGMAVRAYHLSIAGYGSTTAFGVCGGFSLDLTSDLELSLQADNLNQPPLGASGQMIPLLASAAVAYSPTHSLRILGLIVRDVYFPLETRCAVEFTPLAFLSVRGGFSLEPSTIAGGIGLNRRGIRFDYAVRQNPDLGLTHTISLECTPGDF